MRDRYRLSVVFGLNQICELQLIKTCDEIGRLVILAADIWNEYFPSLIGQPQVDYMLQKFQSESVISNHMQDGWQYYFIIAGNKPVGYIGIYQDKQSQVVELSKFYVQAMSRCQGIGKMALTQLIENEILPKMKRISLRVNKDNRIAISAYQRMGFNKIAEDVVDIGNGFVMDDFIFEKSLVDNVCLR